MHVPYRLRGRQDDQVKHRVSDSLSWTCATSRSHQGLRLPIESGRRAMSRVEGSSTLRPIQPQMRVSDS